MFNINSNLFYKIRDQTLCFPLFETFFRLIEMFLL